jgi:O-methyltransferase
LIGTLPELMSGRGDPRVLIRKFRTIRANVECPHNESHILSFVVELFSLPVSVPGVIVEAGCYKGGSTAKISIAAQLIGRPLVVFDSFQGLPPNDEPHTTTHQGDDISGWFLEGAFAGTLDEVRSNVERFGAIEVCEFIPGWFDVTMPTFDTPIAAAYLDVDLADSTRTCLRYLWPRLSPGGVLVSQDGDFPLVTEVFADRGFWKEEVGVTIPTIKGLGNGKMLTITKPAEA